MKKKEYIHVIDSFELDPNFKYRLQRKVDFEMSKNTNNKKSFKNRRVAIFSACLVAVLGVSIVAMPVMADNIPILQSLLNKIEQRNQTNPTKDYSKEVQVTTQATTQDTIAVTSQAETQPAVTTKNDTDYMSVYVDSYYCDGSNLYITYGIQSDDELLSKCNCVTGPLDIKINGQTLDDSTKSTELYTASSDELGLFVGKINVDVSNIEDLDGADIELSFSVNCAFDSIHYDYDYDGLCYTNFRLDTFNVDGSPNEYAQKYLKHYISTDFKLSITDTSQNKTYPVNQTKGGVTVNSITVSPANTTLDADFSSSDSSYAVRLFDSTGTELLWNDNNTYSTPMKDATSITIGLYDDSQAEPVYSFEVPIDRGYATGIDEGCYVDVEPIYNPPMEEVIKNIKSIVEEKYKDTPMYQDASLSLKDVATEEDIVSVKIDDYTVTDSLDGLELDSDLSNEFDYRHINSNGELEDGYKAIVLEATVTNLLDTSQEFCKAFRLSSYMDNFYFEPLAFDRYDGYNHSAYMTTLEPNETKTIKIGYVVSDEALELPLLISVDYGENPSQVRLQ